MKYILENPYRILGVPSNSSLKEIQKAISKLKAFTKINKEYISDFNFQELSSTKQVIDNKTIQFIQRNLNKLKQKIIKVVIMVLIVTFFEGILYMNYDNPVDMLYFAISILALSIGIYLVRKDDHYNKK